MAKEQGPLTAAVFQILLALAEGEMHGYAVMQEVEKQSAGRVRLGPGTLYGSFDRMLAAGLIEECAGPRKKEDNDPRRRYYRLTSGGREALKAEAERLRTAVEGARRKGVFGRPKAVAQ
jgi:DNA-binding PadR family transcriptional regulator